MRCMYSGLFTNHWISLSTCGLSSGFMVKPLRSLAQNVGIVVGDGVRRRLEGFFALGQGGCRSRGFEFYVAQSQYVARSRRGLGRGRFRVFLGGLGGACRASSQGQKHNDRQDLFFDFFASACEQIVGLKTIERQPVE